jgi:hypothetical protein
MVCYFLRGERMPMHRHDGAGAARAGSPYDFFMTRINFSVSTFSSSSFHNRGKWHQAIGHRLSGTDANETIRQPGVNRG